MLKVFQSLVFLLCNILTFDVCFFKKPVQIAGARKNAPRKNAPGKSAPRKITPRK